jgi:hypothetical protein
LFASGRTCLSHLGPWIRSIWLSLLRNTATIKEKERKKANNVKERVREGEREREKGNQIIEYPDSIVAEKMSKWGEELYLEEHEREKKCIATFSFIRVIN